MRIAADGESENERVIYLPLLEGNILTRLFVRNPC